MRQAAAIAAARGRAMDADMNWGPGEIQARARVLAPQILQELTDAARQPSRSPSPSNFVAMQIPRAAHGLTVASIEQIFDRTAADELDWAITKGKRAGSSGARSGAQPELPALPETTGGCPKDMRIKIAQFPWPRSFSGRLLGGAVQLGRCSDLAVAGRL